MIKRLDIYIIKKFLGTFFLTITLILSIAIVLDLTEKLDNFYEHQAPLKAIIFDYYLNFVPYYGILFSPLFTFISVIFFTSKMAGNSEIIAIFSSGVSFKRLLRPYLISAAIIASMSFYLSGYVIPRANEIRLKFEDTYVRKFTTDNVRNVQLEVQPNVIAYIERFEETENKGYHFSMEKFKGKTLISRLTAECVQWDSAYHWKAQNYLIREFDGIHEKITKGSEMDTTITMQPVDFFISSFQTTQMNNTQLKSYLTRQKKRGVGSIQAFEDEYYRRFSMPCAAFILTLIGVSMASRKTKGGMGLHLGIGLTLSFLYILFSTVSTSFTVNGGMSPILSAWLPNIVYSFIAILLFLFARK
jgi:lipopolysaccharide export system permease protein